MKKIINIGLLIFLLIAITGCNAESSKPIQEEYVYVPSFYEYDTECTWVKSGVTFDGSLILCGERYFNRPYSELWKINVDTGEKEEFHINLPENRCVEGMFKTNSGYVIFSEEYVKDNSKADVGLYNWSGAYVSYFDKQFSLLSEIDITDFVAVESGFSRFYYEDMAVDGEGNVYFYFKETIYVIGTDGKLLAEIESKVDRMLDMAWTGEKVMLVYKDMEANTIIAPIDIEKKAVGSSLEKMPDAGDWGKIFAGDEQTFYLSTPDKLWKYDFQAGEWSEELKWLDVDMDGIGLHHCLYLNGAIVTVEYSNLSYEVAVLKKLLSSQAKEKEELTVTMLKKDYYLLEQITDFNRRSRDIRLETMYYVEDDSPEALEKGLQQFQLDLISGDLGDIIFVSAEMDYNNLASKGTFADLNDFLATDPEIHKEDLIENLVDTLSIDGKLYGIVPSFLLRRW